GLPPDERGRMPALVRDRQVFALQCADPDEQLELVAKMRPHHLRPVGGDRERDAVVEESAEGVTQGVLRLESLGQQVRRWAYLENDRRRAQRLHQLGVSGCEDPVTDPVWPEGLDHLADLVDAGVAALLADVDGRAESRLAAFLDER